MGKLYLDANESYILSSPATVYGRPGGMERVIINGGVLGVTLDQNIERMDLIGNVADFTFKQSGNALWIYKAGALVSSSTVQEDADGSQFVFSDGSVAVKFATGGTMTLGGTSLSSATDTAVVPVTIDHGTTSGTTGGSVASGSTVNGGAGNDTLRTNGAGDFVVNAGDGNDTVYIDNSGTVGANWVVGTANATLNSGFLWKGKLTVAFVGPNAANSVTSTTGADSVANSYDNGFEAVVDIPTETNNTVTQLNINQAIKNAINNDPVLSKLVSVQDGTASMLLINSLIDGAFNASDLRITVSATDLTTLLGADQSAALTAYKTYAQNSQATILMAQIANAITVMSANSTNGMDTRQSLAANGTNSAVRSDSTIDLGAGTDVLVMGTGTNSHDTLVFNGYDLGNKTVVNFSDASSALGNNGDNLNFASYLTGQFSGAGSGSLASQNLIPFTVNTDNFVEANSVTQLSGLSFNIFATFAGLNATKLKAAINSTNIGFSNYGGITSATLDAANAYTDGVDASLVGGVGKAVVMVENNLNHGEYKVFELIFNGLGTNTKGDFTDVKLIASVDFGHQITLSTNMI